MAIIDKITPADRALLQPALAMLKPFTGLLAKMDTAGKTASEVADELAGYIPGACMDAMCRLSGLADEHGAEILGLIGPAIMTERWKAILKELKITLEAE